MAGWKNKCSCAHQANFLLSGGGGWCWAVRRAGLWVSERMCCDVVEAVGAVLHACGVLVCCRDRTNGARGAPNRSVMRDLERSWPGCFQFLITKSVPAGPAHKREGCQSGTQMDAHGAPPYTRRVQRVAAVEWLRTRCTHGVRRFYRKYTDMLRKATASLSIKCCSPAT